MTPLMTGRQTSSRWAGRQFDAMSECDEINCHPLLVHLSVLLGFCRVTFLCFYVIVCCHLTRHHLNLHFLVYVSHLTCWRRETRTATNKCGKSFCRHPQTSTCVTVPWDAGSPIARWTLRRCRVWHVWYPAVRCMNCCCHPPHDSDFSASRRCPREPGHTVFNTKTLSRGISGLPLGRLKTKTNSSSYCAAMAVVVVFCVHISDT